MESALDRLNKKFAARKEGKEVKPEEPKELILVPPKDRKLDDSSRQSYKRHESRDSHRNRDRSRSRSSRHSSHHSDNRHDSRDRNYSRHSRHDRRWLGCFVFIVCYYGYIDIFY